MHAFVDPECWDRERIVLLRHFLHSPPPNVTVVLPPSASADSVDVARLGPMPPDLLHCCAVAEPYVWDLTNAPLIEQSRRGTGGDSEFAAGWRLFSRNFPNHPLPSCARARLGERATSAMLASQTLSSNSGGGVGVVSPSKLANGVPAATSGGKTKKSSALRRKSFSPKDGADSGGGTNTISFRPSAFSILTVAACPVDVPQPRSASSGGVPSNDDTQTCVAPKQFPKGHSISTSSVVPATISDLVEDNPELFRILVYCHGLLMVDCFTAPAVPEAVVTQLLDVFRVALHVSPVQHAECLRYLAHPDHRERLARTVDAKELHRLAPVSGSAGESSAQSPSWIPKSATLRTWRRIVFQEADEPTPPRHAPGTDYEAIDAASPSVSSSPAGTAVSLGEVAFSASTSGKSLARRFLELVQKVTLQPSSVIDPETYPPSVAAALLAGAFQVTYVTELRRAGGAGFSHEPAAVTDDQLSAVLVALQQFLGVDDTTVTFCRLHALILAERSIGTTNESMPAAESAVYEVHKKFVEELAFLVAMLQVDGLEAANLREGFASYKVQVLQEVVDSVLQFLEIFDSISNDGLCRAVGHAFFAVCTSLPPLFLSTYLRIDGRPVDCRRGGDSVLMELLACFAGSSLIRELTPPETWLDPSLSIHELIHLVDAACQRPLPFLASLTSQAPHAPAAVVPVFVQILAYILGLYCGHCATSMTTANVPAEFLPTMREVFWTLQSKLPDEARANEAAMDLVRTSIETHLKWLIPLYVKFIDACGETLHAKLKDAAALDWGTPDADTAVKDFMETVLLHTESLHFAVGADLQDVHARYLVTVLNACGRLAQCICGPMVLSTVDDQERECPDAFRLCVSSSSATQQAAAAAARNSAGSQRSSAPGIGTFTPPPGSLSASSSPNHRPVSSSPSVSSFPLKVGLCKQCVARAELLKPKVKAWQLSEALWRLKHLNLLKQFVKKLVNTFVDALWSDTLTKSLKSEVRRALELPQRGASGASVAIESLLREDPTLRLLSQLVEELLRNLNRFRSDCAEVVAVHAVYASRLHDDMEEKLYVLDMKHYRTYKHDKKYLLAEGKNAHMRPLHPQITIPYILDQLAEVLQESFHVVGDAETIVLISSFLYVHLLSIFATTLLFGGGDRFYYPEQAADFLRDVELIETFFTSNIPVDDDDESSGSMYASNVKDIPRPTSTTLWHALTRKIHAETTTLWWEGGTLALGTLRVLLKTAFSEPSNELVGGNAVHPPYAALPEVSETSPWCRFVLRSILHHRKDPVAKKFCQK